MVTGPLIPYPNNPLNPAIYLEKSPNSTCGTWVSEYARLHDGKLTNHLDHVSFVYKVTYLMYVAAAVVDTCLLVKSVNFHG